MVRRQKVDMDINLDYIRKRREDLNLSQMDLGWALGMKSGAPAYNKYEKGSYRFKAEHLPKLAQVLHCTIDDFFCPAN